MRRGAGEGKRVFVHCVQAQNRTPTIAATYLARHHGVAPDQVLDLVEASIGTRPRHFLVDTVDAVDGNPAGQALGLA